MTRRLLTILVLLGIGSNTFAQYFNEKKNDLEGLNLKGPVVEIAETIYEVNESFGEWNRGNGSLYNYMVFDKNGNLLLDAIREREIVEGIGSINVIKGFRTYWYGDNGKVSATKESNTYSNGYFTNLINLQSTYATLMRKYTFLNEYEYDQNGTIKSITKKQGDQIVEKRIYKYNDNGYEIWYYNGSGKRNTDKVYILHNNERIIQEGEPGTHSTQYYDEKGRLFAITSGIVAVNGEMGMGAYYEYNERGDVLTRSNSLEGVKSIKGLESLYPIVGERNKQRDAYVFDYEYDSWGNWLVRKIYGIRNDEVIVFEWDERRIKYSNEGEYGEKLVESLLSAVDSLNKRELEKMEQEKKKEEEWAARPWSAELSDAFIPWISASISYPEESTALGSILKVKGSSIEIGFVVDISIEGDITCEPVDQWNGRIVNNKSFVTERKKQMALTELEEMESALYANFKNVPDGIKGKNKSRWKVEILIANGRISCETRRSL